jgi:hypothetical protein
MQYRLSRHQTLLIVVLAHFGVRPDGTRRITLSNRRSDFMGNCLPELAYANPMGLPPDVTSDNLQRILSYYQVSRHQTMVRYQNTVAVLAAGRSSSCSRQRGSAALHEILAN